MACAAALAVLDTIETHDLMSHATARGAQLVAALQGASGVTEVQGAGLLWGVGLTDSDAPRVVATAQRAGFLVNATGPGRLRLAPALTISTTEIGEFGAAWPGILNKAQKGP